MSEEIKANMRQFLTALIKADVDTAASFCTEDVIWETPEGKFEGIEEFKRYGAWMSQIVADLSHSESGVGILVEGDKAAFEHRFSGVYEGQPVEWPALCIYEFAGGKIRRLRTVHDRLGILQQGAKGWLEETLIHSLVKRVEKGLH